MFYLDLFNALEECRVRYVLIGGLAMNLHGIPRMTMDVDIMVALDSDNLGNFAACAKKLNLKPDNPLELGDFLRPESREIWKREKGMIAFCLRAPDPKAPSLDVLLDPPLDMQAVLKRAVKREVENTTIYLASLEDMIFLKEQANRAQDASDLVHLKDLLGDVDNS